MKYNLVLGVDFIKIMNIVKVRHPRNTKKTIAKHKGDMNE